MPRATHISPEIKYYLIVGGAALLFLVLVIALINVCRIFFGSGERDNNSMLTTFISQKCSHDYHNKHSSPCMRACDLKKKGMFAGINTGPTDIDVDRFVDEESNLTDSATVRALEAKVLQQSELMKRNATNDQQDDHHQNSVNSQSTSATEKAVGAHEGFNREASFFTHTS